MSVTAIIFISVFVVLFMGLILIKTFEKTGSISQVFGFVGQLLLGLGSLFALFLIVAIIWFIGSAGVSLVGSAVEHLNDPLDSSYVSEDTNADSNIHHVNPHAVNGYTRSDGTNVDGYWRGGTDGYMRSNPDGNPYNNLN